MFVHWFNTMCPRCSYPFYIVSYYIKWWLLLGHTVRIFFLHLWRIYLSKIFKGSKNVISYLIMVCLIYGRFKMCGTIWRIMYLAAAIAAPGVALPLVSISRGPAVHSVHNWVLHQLFTSKKMYFCCCCVVTKTVLFTYMQYQKVWFNLNKSH